MNTLFSITLIFCFIIIKNGNATTLKQNEITEICNHYTQKRELSGFQDNCELVTSIIKTESSYKIESYNPEKSGSYGLMQIQCDTAKMIGLKYNCEQLFDPRINIRFGMKYLLWLRKNKEIKSIEDLIAAWNAGSPYICKELNRDKNTHKILCYPGEYINYSYVMKVRRLYTYLRKKAKEGEKNELVTNNSR